MGFLHDLIHPRWQSLESDAMTLFLSPAELIELTERTRKASQVAWLIANNYPFALGANGHPRVFQENIY